MRDATDAPSFLVEHQILNDAANGQLGAFLDGILLQGFVATIPSDHVAPSRVTRANAAIESKSHGGAFYVEWLIIFHDADGVGVIEFGKVGFDRLKEKFEAEFLQEIARLGDVRSVAEIERERFEPAEIHPHFAHG